MHVFTDQVGNAVHISSTPKRIISLVPSQTELLFELGLDEEVIGITKFCVHPENWFRTKTRVGGTKQPDIELIRQLKPDLIIANKEENVQSHIEALAADYPVWASDINNLEDALEMIVSIGQITGTEKKANELVEEIEITFAELPALQSKISVAYLIWKDPYMAAGADTFISDMLSDAGFVNAFGYATRYPEVSIADLSNCGCQYIFLSSEPYPFKQKHAEELEALLPSVKIIMVDGEMFSWYGSRLLHAAHYFKALRQNME